MLQAWAAEAASIRFDQPFYVGLASEARVLVEDPDLNTDPGSEQSLLVRVVSSSDPDGIDLMLFETASDSGLFQSGPLGFSTSASGADRILVAHGATLAALYQDLDPYALLSTVAVWYATPPAPSPTPTRSPTPPPTDTPTATPTPTPTEPPPFTPVPIPTQKLPKILLVDDDGSPVLTDVGSIYAQAMRDAGLTFDSASGSQATADKLKNYQVVVWFTGEAYIDTLTTKEQQALTTFLIEQRGKLLLSSQDLLYETTGDLDGSVNSSTFAAQWLGVRSVINDAIGPAVIEGVDGTLTEGMQLVLDPSRLIIEADQITHSGQTYLTDSELNPVALLNTSTPDNYGTAFFAIPLEAIEEGPGNSRLSTLLRRTICAALADCGDPKAAGRVFFNKPIYYSERDQAVITLYDSNLNTNPDTQQLAIVGVSSTFSGMAFTLKETGPNTGIFDSATAGLNVRFSTTTFDPARGMLKVFDGDSVAVGYGDYSPPSGSNDRAFWFSRDPPTETPTPLLSPTPTPAAVEPTPPPQSVPALERALLVLPLLALLLGGLALKPSRRR